jgi:hypothetical protein
MSAASSGRCPPGTSHGTTDRLGFTSRSSTVPDEFARITESTPIFFRIPFLEQRQALVGELELDLRPSKALSLSS